MLNKAAFGLGVRVASAEQCSVSWVVRIIAAANRHVLVHVMLNKAAFGLCVLEITSAEQCLVLWVVLDHRHR